MQYKRGVCRYKFELMLQLHVCRLHSQPGNSSTACFARSNYMHCIQAVKSWRRYFLQGAPALMMWCTPDPCRLATRAQLQQHMAVFSLHLYHRVSFRAVSTLLLSSGPEVQDCQRLSALFQHSCPRSYLTSTREYVVCHTVQEKPALHMPVVLAKPALRLHTSAARVFHC
jgi:hypothetical protein